MTEITIPYDYKPRPYQKDLFKALDSGFKRAVTVWHRRAGKDKSMFNLLIKKALERRGVYYYLFPEFAQARRVIWDGVDGSGFKFMDHIPEIIIQRKNSTDMKVELVNGSIIQLIGTDKFDKVRGSNPVGCVFSEFAFHNPKAYNLIRPILAENGGWSIFNSTPNGKNHFYEMYKNAVKNQKWFTQFLTVDDTFDWEGNPIITQESIQEERESGMSEDMIKQEFYCFLPHLSDIITIDGVKDISEICNKDLVLTHGNSYRRVKGVLERDYRGKILQIKIIGNNKPIYCTPNHPFRVCNDGVNNIWKKAEDLISSDRLTMPKPLLSKISTISKDLAFIISWFITEGSCGKNTVQFTLNLSKEGDIALELKEKVFNEFGLETTFYDNIKNNTRNVTICSRDLREFLISNCGSGSLNKKIPHIINGHEELVFNNLIKGDGCIYKNEYIYSTISKTLAYQVQLLGNSLGYKMRVREIESKSKGFILNREVSLNTAYDVRGNNSISSKYIKKHKYNYSTKIKSIEEFDYNGVVYNLEVAEENSYTVNSVVVHNCSWTANAQGFYYLSMIEAAEAEGRVGKVPFDHSSPVETWWDIGVGDNTCIWFTQTKGNVIHVIDYYKSNGKGISHYVKKLQQKPYVYKSHNFPHDMGNTEFGTGRTRLEVAEELFKGVRVNIIQKISVEDGINAVRMVLPACYFDKIKCADGIDGLRNYHKEYDEKKQEYKNKPVHDWASDPSDSFRYMAIGITMPRSRSFKNEFMRKNAKLISTKNWKAS